MMPKVEAEVPEELSNLSLDIVSKMRSSNRDIESKMRSSCFFGDKSFAIKRALLGPAHWAQNTQQNFVAQRSS